MVFVLVACVSIFRAALIPSDQVLGSVDDDTRLQFYAWRHFGFTTLADGTIPLWNPYILCGTPFVAGFQSAVFYPPNWLHLVLPTAAAINVLIILHCFLAGAFMYAFVRGLGLRPISATMAAVVFMLGAQYFVRVYAGHLSVLSTMVWTPLILLCWESFLRRRRLGVFLATVVVVQILSPFHRIQISLAFPSIQLPPAGATDQSSYHGGGPTA